MQLCDDAVAHGWGSAMSTTASLPGPSRAPPPLAKAPATSGLSPESATAFSPRLARSSSPGPQTLPQAQTRRGARVSPSDPLSDSTTAFLIRRILCSQNADKGRSTPAPIEDLLPPLTSRNDVDLQLYALLAIVLREFVQSWYGKMTPDETLVAELIQLVAHCTRALEQRLRNVDLLGLLLDELPDLIDRHVSASRAAHDPVSRPPIHADPRAIYHALFPHPALSPVPNPDRPQDVAAQAENEAAYRQLLAQGVLAVLLPTEDLENPCLTALFGQILAELLIGNILAKSVAEPWCIWEGLTLASNLVQARRATPCEAEQQDQPASKQGGSFTFQRLVLVFLHCCSLATTLVRGLVATLILSRALPARDVHRGCEKTSHEEVQDAADGQPEPFRAPLLAFRCWGAVSNLVGLDRRMPWLSGTLSMLQWLAMTGPGHIAAYNGIVDRLLSHYLERYLLDPGLLPSLLRQLRSVLFPNNTPGVSSLFPPGSEEELLERKRKCAGAIWGIFPKWWGRVFFGGGNSCVGRGNHAVVVLQTEEVRKSQHSGANEELASAGARDDVQAKLGGATTTTGGRGVDDEPEGQDQDEEMLREIETGLLNVFGDAYCNKHLLYGILELVLVRLMPELSERGVSEMWADRIC